MTWNKDLTNIIRNLRDAASTIEDALTEIHDKLKETKRSAFDKGYNTGYTDGDKQGYDSAKREGA